MKRHFLIILGSLIALNSFSVCADINTVYNTNNSSQKNGAVVINGKLIAYEKCFPQNITEAQRDAITEQVRRANAAGVKTGIDPDNIPDCK